MKIINNNGKMSISNEESRIYETIEYKAYEEAKNNNELILNSINSVGNINPLQMSILEVVNELDETLYYINVVGDENGNNRLVNYQKHNALQNAFIDLIIKNTNGDKEIQKRNIKIYLLKIKKYRNMMDKNKKMINPIKKILKK